MRLLIRPSEMSAHPIKRREQPIYFNLCESEENWVNTPQNLFEQHTGLAIFIYLNGENFFRSMRITRQPSESFSTELIR